MKTGEKTEPTKHSENLDKSFFCGSVEEGIREIEKGNLLIVTDSEDRENEGDLVIAAEDISPEKVNFMATHARGLICVPLSQEKAEKIELAPMVKSNQDVYRTAFTISVDARKNTTTGISAYDRSITIKNPRW